MTVRTQYWRDIAIVVSLKALALGLLYLWFFAPADHAEPGASATFRHLAAPASETAHD